MKRVIEGGVGHGVLQVLDRYADEIGINVNTLTDYRHTAIVWPPDKWAPGVPWSVHRALSALPDRFDVILPPPQKARNGGRRTSPSAGRSAFVTGR